jgi:ring-1,2-phenylacetyl-CoA epoxidase subunit PaaC
MDKQLKNYLLYIADNGLIMGHRLSEWCGHGPVLEQDMALSNIALDLIGHARFMYQHIAKLEGNGATEDDYPYKRDVIDFKNLLLAEQKNGDFGRTIVRQAFFDSFNYLFTSKLVDSTDQDLSSYAQKALKEVKYHKYFSHEWFTRLGDGTEESKQRMQVGVDKLWPYIDEAFKPASYETDLLEKNIAVDLSTIKEPFYAEITELIERATLKKPEHNYMQYGGKDGNHTEHLGFILSDLQFLQRAYPGQEW